MTADQGRSRRSWAILAAGGLALIGLAIALIIPSCSTPRAVPDSVVAASTTPSIGYSSAVSPTGARLPAISSTSSTPQAISTGSAPSTPIPTTTLPTKSLLAGSSRTLASASNSALPQIGPAAAKRLQVPAIGVDAGVLPVDSEPTGQTNAFGGPIYSAIDFPVDDDVRQWVQRGDPNSITPDLAADNVKEFDRVVIYGHASDIGNHLVFQDLAKLHLGDTMIVTTDLGVFTYRVTLVATNDKSTLENMAALYDYPKDGHKELALVGCLPDTTSNAVVIGELVDARAR